MTGYSAVVVYSGSDQDYGFRDQKTWQRASVG